MWQKDFIVDIKIMQLRVAVLNITGGGVSGGHRKYLVNMLPRLAAIPHIEAILVASPAVMKAPDWIPSDPKIQHSICKPFRPFLHYPDATLYADLERFVPDIVFVPIERYVKFKNVPTVVMVQNMAPFAGVETGDGLREKLVSLLRNRESRIALAKAEAVIAPTETVRGFLIENKLVVAEKIVAIPYGYNPVNSFKRPAFPADFSGSDFVFTAGSIEKYRGLEDLIHVLPLIRESFPGLKLVIAGSARPETVNYLDLLKGEAERLRVSKDIFWLGNISQEELAWCYANCSVFTATSRIESFCFVALEALASSCNCVSATSPCLPEIFSDAAIYYTPSDLTSLADALRLVLRRTPEERVEAGRVALARASSFSWDTTVNKTVEIFKSVMRS